MQFLSDDLVIFYSFIFIILLSAFLSAILSERWLIKRNVTPADDVRREVDLAPAGLSVIGSAIATLVFCVLYIPFHTVFNPLTSTTNPLGVPLLVVAIVLTSYCGARLAYTITQPVMNENPFALNDSECEQSDPSHS